ncbi:branched-chain amino acid transport family protein [Roseivivax marinus]|jgi:branched-subunit amino acid transport protein|uniref:Branched-chain amino acid transport family protein n=1 Tax=Roseivivax marinus TaxID=1379903 RepID=W4HNQ0_9RHOB|nr:AzlD domain-containing protein [Roseivivax marinus]ETW13635.1 branched-chain amino acid transport family protein [Roseivivax marinus]UMA65211.1 AzlD domain-containing protein [Roseivivax marinus]SEK53620.1 Branched-chain amino acid transport protein [Roseivivax marinus]
MNGNEIATSTLWIVIFGLGIGSFALRIVFLGLIGDRALPPWVLRHLRYTAAAILPALVAPLVVWPAATDGEPDPVRLFAALATFAVAFSFRNVLAAMITGAATLGFGLWLFS